VARRAVVRRLTAEGRRVVEGDSSKVPRGLSARTLSCALLDLDLGDGDGADLARALRRTTPKLPIAFFSAGAAEELVARASKIGPVFKKPDQLDEALRWVLSRG
jgi:DNA-binding response OmpR family regulator